MPLKTLAEVLGSDITRGTHCSPSMWSDCCPCPAHPIHPQPAFMILPFPAPPQYPTPSDLLFLHTHTPPTTPTGLSQRHALAREAEDRVALEENRSPLRWALHALALALHEQTFGGPGGRGGGGGGGAWPTAALLSIALLEAAIFPPHSPALPLGLLLPLLVLGVAIARRWWAAWCVRFRVMNGDERILLRPSSISHPPQPIIYLGACA